MPPLLMLVKMAHKHFLYFLVAKETSHFCSALGSALLMILVWGMPVHFLNQFKTMKNATEFPSSQKENQPNFLS